MRTKTILSAALSLALAAPCLAAIPSNVKTTPATPATADVQGVARANAQFYKALNTLFTGNPDSFVDVWSHADDVVYMGPMGGIVVGWDQIRTMGESQAARKLGGKVEPQDIHTTIGNDLAIVQCYERGFNLDAQGRPLEVSIRATNVFRKENGQWKMIGHHTDLLPFLAK